MKKIKIYDFGLLGIIFPDYLVVSCPTFVRKVIYTSFSLNNVYHEETYVLVDKDADVNLSSKSCVLEFVFSSKAKISPSKTLLKHIEKVSEEVFKKELLWFMATGKWKKLDVCEYKVYNLFEALIESRVKFFNLYFALRIEHSFEELWASVLTFFQRVVSGESTGLSDYYQRVIDRFTPQVSKIKMIKNLFLQDSFNELVGLNFIASVRG